MSKKISELIQRAPDGTEFLEVIIPPFTSGTNRKVLLSDILALAGGGAVDSVNGETGVVVLDATDVGADPSGSAATVASNLSAHIADTTDAHDASAISFSPTGTIAATDAQAAIAEAASESVAGLALKLNLTGGTMSGAIAMGNNKITGLAAASTNGDAVRYDEFTSSLSDMDYIMMQSFRNTYNY